MDFPELSSIGGDVDNSSNTSERDTGIVSRLLADAGYEPWEDDVDLGLPNDEISRTLRDISCPKVKTYDVDNNNIPFPDVPTCNDFAMEQESIFSCKRSSDEPYCGTNTKKNADSSGIETNHELNSASCAFEDSDTTLFVHSRTGEEILTAEVLSNVTVEDIENNVETDECINEAQQLNINDLPQELLQKIFTYLSQYDLCHSVAGTCRLWRNLAYDPVHWQMLDFYNKNVAPGTLIPSINRATRLKQLKWHDELTLDEVT